MLGVTSTSEAMADAAVEDIAQLLGDGRDRPVYRGHGQTLIEVLNRTQPFDST